MTTRTHLDALHAMLDRVNALPADDAYPTRRDLTDTALNALIGYIAVAVPDEHWDAALAYAENAAAAHSLRWMPDPPEQGNEPVDFDAMLTTADADVTAAGWTA